MLMGKLSFISSSNVGKLIAKLLIAFTLFLIIDNVLYFILERNSREHAVGTFYSFLKVLHTQPKIVILGASAAQNHYVAPLIAANTQSTVYNFGIGGGYFFSPIFSDN